MRKETKKQKIDRLEIEKAQLLKHIYILIGKEDVVKKSLIKSHYALLKSIENSMWVGNSLLDNIRMDYVKKENQQFFESID